MANSSESKRMSFQQNLHEVRDDLYRFARNAVWDRNKAEDVLQDATMKAFKKYGHYKQGTNFKAWIFRFLVNTILNENKRKRNRMEVSLAQQDVDILRDLEREDQYFSILEDPEAFFDRVGGRVKQAVLALNQHERVVFLLCCVQGFTYREVSTMLKIPMGTVMSHVSRSRAKLRERLADYARQIGFARGSVGAADEEEA